MIFIYHIVLTRLFRLLFENKDNIFQLEKDFIELVGFLLWLIGTEMIFENNWCGICILCTTRGAVFMVVSNYSESAFSWTSVLTWFLELLSDTEDDKSCAHTMASQELLLWVFLEGSEMFGFKKVVVGDEWGHFLWLCL